MKHCPILRVFLPFFFVPISQDIGFFFVLRTFLRIIYCFFCIFHNVAAVVFYRRSCIGFFVSESKKWFDKSFTNDSLHIIRIDSKFHGISFVKANCLRIRSLIDYFSEIGSMNHSRTIRIIHVERSKKRIIQFILN